MNIEDLCSVKDMVDGDTEVFVQVGFNRFPIESVNIFDDSILLVVTENADNPKPIINNRRA